MNKDYSIISLILIILSHSVFAFEGNKHQNKEYSQQDHTNPLCDKIGNLLLETAYDQVVFFNNLPRKIRKTKCDDYTEYLTRDLQNAPSNIDIKDADQLPFLTSFTCEESINFGKSYYTKRNNIKLHYRFYTNNQNSQRVLFYAPGMTGYILHGTRYLDLAKKYNMNLVIIDYSNHGESYNDGQGTTFGCNEGLDISAVLKDLKNQHHVQDIIIISSSMGNIATLNSLVELEKSPERSIIKGFIFESPMLNIKDMYFSVLNGELPDVIKSLDYAGTSTFYKFLFNSASKMPLKHCVSKSFFKALDKRRGFNVSRGCHSLTGAKLVKEPLLVLHTKADMAVSYQVSEKLYNAVNTNAPFHKFISYKNGSHSAVYNYNHEDFVHQFDLLYNQIFNRQN